MGTLTNIAPPPAALRIAWVGPAPGEDGSVARIATELLDGLATLGHQIDCFSPEEGFSPPRSLTENDNIAFVWGRNRWKWERWYSRIAIVAFVTGLLARGFAALRLRRQLRHRHRRRPYDVIYQFSTIESLSVPRRVARRVPLVIHPETHSAGELRFLLAERRLSRECQANHVLAIAAATLFVRTVLQRRTIRRARLLVCVSSVFRDHLVNDYGIPARRTVVVPNPVHIARFAGFEPTHEDPPTVLVLGRVAVRKGIQDVVAVAHELRDRGVGVRLRVVGGPSQWSDYTALLEHLPIENAEYVGQIASQKVPAELARSDVLLQASRYEPFALTVAEALAAGVPVVATTEVGAIEGVDRSVAAEVSPGDVAGMASAIAAMLERSKANPTRTRATARAEAARLFSTELVCGQLAAALHTLVSDERGMIRMTIPGMHRRDGAG
jgi:glycosyltransferase involved in cell wall biosynthesis